jgi:hypothetical protein
MDLQSLASKTKWSPREVFPPSSVLTARLFACGGGLYLMTNPKRGEGDPVRAVGWAESDYWARRVWEYPNFRDDDLTPPPPQWRPPPSLVFLGRPESLSLRDIRDFEGAQAGARKATLLSARYRMTDGAFLHCSVNGVDGVTYVYASNDPDPRDEPVAIELKLPDGT